MKKKGQVRQQANNLLLKGVQLKEIKEENTKRQAVVEQMEITLVEALPVQICLITLPMVLSNRVKI